VLNEPSQESRPLPTAAMYVGALALLGLVLNAVAGYWFVAAACLLLLASVVIFIRGGQRRTTPRARLITAFGAVVLIACASAVLRIWVP